MPVDTVGSYEDIMNALLLWIQQHTGYGTLTPTFQSYARGIVMWEQLSMVQNNNPIIRQPALYLYDGVGFGGGKTRYEQKSRSLPVLRIISRTIVIYAKWPDPVGMPGGMGGGKGVLATGGGTIFHPLIQAVESAIETPDDFAQGTLTLGGLVSHCWVEGEGLLVSPDIDDNGQGMATLPVQILVPTTSP